MAKKTDATAPTARIQVTNPRRIFICLDKLNARYKNAGIINSELLWTANAHPNVKPLSNMRMYVGLSISQSDRKMKKT